MEELINGVNALGDLGLAALIIIKLFSHDKRLTIIETKLG